jgi:hypothetical protein
LHSGFNTAELTREFINVKKDTVTIVAFGHVYSLLTHEDVFDEMIEQINSENPDYVWILGDVVYNNSEEEWDYVLAKYKGIKGRRFHAGGNHDMNYHYERYYGIVLNQWEAESRFLNKIGYRYKTLEDNVANYMVVNMNDSIDRIKDYLHRMLPELNPDKQSILFTHQAIWHNIKTDPEDPKTSPRKTFDRDSLLSEITDFDYLIHGDWGGKLYIGAHKYKNKKYKLVAVGNRNEGDQLFFATLKITQDTVIAYNTFVNIPDTTTWKKVEK